MSLIVDATSAGRAVPVVPQGRPDPAPASSPAEGLRIEVPLDLVSFRAVTTGPDLRRIAHLREEIALSAQVREAPAFARLEKKETRSGWSVPSSAWGR